MPVLSAAVTSLITLGIGGAMAKPGRRAHNL
jgi:hypothetical protein